MAIDDLGAFADTVAGAAPDMTIRPPAGATAGMAMAATQADLGRTLPRLHVDEAGGAVAQGGDAPEAADLLVYGTLGEGGMGQVLLARQPSLSRDVAVKALRPTLTHPSAAALLMQEARVMGALEHPGVVPVHVLGMGQDGMPLLVMKRVDGVSLRTLLSDRQHATLDLLPGGRADPLQGFLWVLAQVCNAVHFAHSRGVIHRDHVRHKKPSRNRDLHGCAQAWGKLGTMAESGSAHRARGRARCDGGA